VSGKSKRERYWTGHTTCNRVLAFTSQESDLLGTYIPVRITDASQSSLNGEHVR
jgi:tRNA A37 methylthiotransferase MiaB